MGPSKMGSNTMPVRLAHGWAIAWLDFYQTPAIVSEGVWSEVKGFFREVTRGHQAYPHNIVNPMTATTNRLGRPEEYANNDEGWAFAGCAYEWPFLQGRSVLLFQKDDTPHCAC